MSAEVSHGRGGAGNISKDDTKYVDGEVTRQGVEGSHKDGAFSTGRGGAGNVGDSSTAPAQHRNDQEVVPPEATAPAPEGDYHTGRGGAGNTKHADKPGTGTVAQPPAEAAAETPAAGKISFADRVLNKIKSVLKKK